MAVTTDSDQQQASSSGSGSTSLWSSILASTSTAIATGSGTPQPQAGTPANNSGSKGSTRKGKEKRVVVLGGHDSGTSTLLNAVQAASSSRQSASDRQSAGSSSNNNKGKNVAQQEGATPDLGLNFQYIDLSEGDEDASSRISVYQLPNPSSCPSLLPLAFHPDSLQDALVLVVLDWERPWRLMSTLKSWIEQLHAYVATTQARKGKGKRTELGREGALSGEYIVHDAREALETLVRSYTEPQARDASGLPTSSNTPHSATTQLDDQSLPLPQGSLIHNIGLQLCIVITKSDLIHSQHERNQDLNEEQVDWIIQCLRTICLAYGASLHFTSTFHPHSFARLQAYLLHRLFTSPSQTATRPFSYRANVVERESILIPSGWDSYGKIRILREGFDSASFSKSWSKTLHLAQNEEEEDGTVGALELFDHVLGQDPSLASLPPGGASGNSGRLEVQDEQDFFKIHYDVLAREAAKNPRPGHGGPSSSSQNMSRAASTMSDASLAQQDPLSSAASRYFASAGIQPGQAGSSFSSSGVGPMQSTSLNLPSVERVLDSHSSAPPSASSAAPMLRRDSSRLAQLNGAGSPPSLASPTVGGSGSAGSPAPPQNEVLANFFQSLLSSRSDRQSGGGGTTPKLPSSAPAVKSPPMQAGQSYDAAGRASPAMNRQASGSRPGSAAQE